MNKKYSGYYLPSVGGPTANLVVKKNSDMWFVAEWYGLKPYLLWFAGWYYQELAHSTNSIFMPFTKSSAGIFGIKAEFRGVPSASL